MRTISTLVPFLLLGGPLTAQQLIETFSYANGPVIPGWTPRNSGSWSIVNGRLTKTGGSSPDFLTKDGITARNCVGSCALPLALDLLFDLTLANATALGLAGVVDANGDGAIAFPIPNSPALVGSAFFAEAVTIDTTLPFAIGVISQDLRVVVQA